MGLAQKLIGYVSGRGVEVDSYNQLCAGLPVTADQTGCVRIQGCNDDGTITGIVRNAPPEVDSDYRLRTSDDVILDDEIFNYVVQNTAKHTIVAAAVNLAPSWTAGGYNTNPTSVVTSASGATLQSYATFALVSTGTLSCDIEAAFSALPSSNQIIDFGLFNGSASNPFAPTDGAYFRLTSAGLTGVCNYNGTETFSSTSPFPLSRGAGVWTYTPNKKYQFILYITSRDVQFWVNDGTVAGALLLGTIPCPDGQGTMFLSSSVPFRVRHAIVGGAGGAALNFVISRYCVRLGGVTQTDTLALFGSRALGAYQGLGGQPLGSLMGGTVTTGTVIPPTAATPVYTAALLGTGMGGSFYDTMYSMAGTDGIVCSYQCTTGSVTAQARRMKVTGVGIGSWVQTLLGGGPLSARFYIAFGHTAVSLATAESSTAKAPRRVMTPIVQNYTVNQAANTSPTQNICQYTFQNPIYVNPGEFIQLIKTQYGTVCTTGVVAHNVSWDYSWE